MKTHALRSVIPRLLGAGAVLAIAGVLIAGTASATEWVTPTITAPYQEGGFSIDAAARMYPFILAGNGDIARQRTSLYIGHNSNTLYVLLSAEESDMAGVRLEFARGQAARVRQADSVSLYFRFAEDILEFSVASDERLDEVRWSHGQQDPSWSGDAQWRVDRPDEWRGLLSIPLEALGITGEASGQSLEFAAVRREQPYQEISGWPACQGGASPPEKLGETLIGGRAECVPQSVHSDATSGWRCERGVLGPPGGSSVSL